MGEHAHDWLASNAMVWIKQGRLRHRPVLTKHPTEYGRCGNDFWEVARKGQLHASPGWRPVRPERIRLWVEDNDIGIPRRMQQKILEIFQRLHRTDGMKGPASGWPLSPKPPSAWAGTWEWNPSRAKAADSGLNCPRRWPPSAWPIDAQPIGQPARQPRCAVFLQ